MRYRHIALLTALSCSLALADKSPDFQRPTAGKPERVIVVYKTEVTDKHERKVTKKNGNVNARTPSTAIWGT